MHSEAEMRLRTSINVQEFFYTVGRKEVLRALQGVVSRSRGTELTKGEFRLSIGKTFGAEMQNLLWMKLVGVSCPFSSVVKFI